MEGFDSVAALPFFVLIGAAVLLLLLDLAGVAAKLRLPIGLAGVLGAGASYFPQSYLRETAFKGLVHLDAFSFAFATIILIGTALALLLGSGQAKAQRAIDSVDVDVLLLLASCGGLVMVSAANLIVLFLGFELLSVCVYVLSGIAKGERASAEGALKYFILGAFSSAFLLYGMTLVYGATGSMDLVQIGQAATLDNPMLLIGLGLTVFGFAFKVGAVPFHFWTPDVYQGAPVSIAAYMAVVVKAAAFGSFLRVVVVAFGSVQTEWVSLLWLLSVVTMTVGNILALWQRSVKRMLAYSSIAHAGYALIGFVVLGSAAGGEATIFYLAAYTAMTIAAFGVVLLASGGTQFQYGTDDMQSLKGLGWSRPFLGLVMTVALLSLAGMPPLGGFVAKFYLFSAAVKGGYTGLAVIAALNSVVSLYYYLGVIVVMYFSGEGEERSAERVPFAPGLALAIATVGIFYLGFFSEDCFRFVQLAMASLS